ncbi:MAG TPA: serine hydrolase domain-containing protein [Steroidobacteraceae bacterium]|nr:serine hydrolase domain-containing protein [Steroidobacteraceae bacterium]
MTARLASFIVAAAAASIASAARADAPQPATPPALTAEDAAAFLDGMLPTAMAIGDVAGATVAIVKDDALLLTRAYGLADVEKRVPVSAQDTLFRPASISKLFTWTAVMQQVEAGKLDLDHDINEYLDFRIEGYGGQPIKLRHLMTHTAGFEESLLDLLVDDVSHVKPLGEALKHSIPARIYPPGTVPAYSNYGASLAGYIVSRASGMPFEQYIEERIFEPLKMEHSTFRQTLPGSLREHLSNSYAAASGKPVPFEYGSDVPAGALSATAPDMAQFMMAHLNGGLLPGGDDSSRILKPETTELMHSVANRPAPVVDAMALGFYEQGRNGVRVIAHGGDLTAFHSELVLIPAAKVGLFISFNSSGKENAVYKVRTAVYEGFMDRYFPRQAPAPVAPPSDASQHAAALVGNYEGSRRADQNLFSFFYMFSQTAAEVRDDGSLVINGLDALNGEPKRFREVQPWLWQEEHGEQRLAVGRDEHGGIVSLVPDGYGAIIVFQRPPLWRNKAWLVPAVMVAGGIIGLALLIRVIAFLRRRFSRAGAAAVAADRNRRRSLAAILSCAIFIGSCLTVLTMFSSESFWVISSDGRWFVRLVQLSALLCVLGAIVAIIVAVDTWRAPARTLSLSIGRTALAAACLVWAYVAVAFHFLAVRLQY